MSNLFGIKHAENGIYLDVNHLTLKALPLDTVNGFTLSKTDLVISLKNIKLIKHFAKAKIDHTLFLVHGMTICNNLEILNEKQQILASIPLMFFSKKSILQLLQDLKKMRPQIQFDEGLNMALEQNSYQPIDKKIFLAKWDGGKYLLLITAFVILFIIGFSILCL